MSQKGWVVIPAELRKKYKVQVQKTLQRVGESIEKTGIKNWDFGRLEESLALEKGAVKIKAYPSLKIDRESVDLKLVDNPLQAEYETRRGLCRNGTRDAFQRRRSGARRRRDPDVRRRTRAKAPAWRRNESTTPRAIPHDVPADRRRRSVRVRPRRLRECERRCRPALAYLAYRAQRAAQQVCHVAFDAEADRREERPSRRRPPRSRSSDRPASSPRPAPRMTTPPGRCARRRNGDGAESRADRRSLPSRCRQKRGSNGLPLGPHSQAGDAGLGNGKGVRLVSLIPVLVTGMRGV